MTGSNAKVVRVGVIGPGSIADERLVPALKKIPGAVFWSALGRDLEKTKAFAQKHGAGAAKAAHAVLEEFLSDSELDAVIVASPDKLHAAQAIACAKAGKHVFVEKPLATSSKDAEAIVAACREANVQLAVGYHLRYHAGHRKLLTKLDSNPAVCAIGKIEKVDVSWTLQSKTADWRASDALGQWWSLAALGTHSLDLVSWLLSGDKVKDVECEMSSPVFGSAHDETSIVNLVFESGVTARILSSVVMREPRVVEIVGSKGTVRCEETLGPRGTGKIIINGEEMPFIPADPYEGELKDFIVSVACKQMPAVSGAIGAANVALLERIAAVAVRK